MELDRAALALGALGTPVRLEVYRVLVRAGRTGLSVGDIQAKLGGVPRSTLAHHLGKLVGAGLVTQEKDGASIMSYANYTLMNGLVAFLTESCCVEETSPAAPCGGAV